MDKAQPIWIVRAGENAAYVDEFLKDGLAAIGWKEIGHVDAGIPDEEIDSRFLAAYPDEKERWRRVAGAMVKRFARDIHPGHLIATSDRNRRVYPLGTVTGEVQWRDHSLPRFRKVAWTHEVDRDVLSAAARNSLGAIATMFRLGPEIAAEMWSKARPIGSAASTTSLPHRPAPTEEENEEVVLLDVEAKAQQFVEDRLARLDWREMQELVASILRAMGYRMETPARKRGVSPALGAVAAGQRQTPA